MLAFMTPFGQRLYHYGNNGIVEGPNNKEKLDTKILDGISISFSLILMNSQNCRRDRARSISQFQRDKHRLF